MGRPRKAWRDHEGDKGERVSMYETRLGGNLRWDYRDAEGERRRPWVTPRMKVRTAPDRPVDPILEREARSELKRFYHELRGNRAPDTLESHNLTVGDAFTLKFDPKRNALPKSRSARIHWEAARTFWTEELGTDRLWNDVPPADVWGPLLRLRDDEGKAETAKKRLQILRGLAKWLKEAMRFRGIEDPTLGLKVSKLMEGYTPRRPRLLKPQVAALRKALADLDPRERLFYRLMTGSVTRAIQARTVMRSGLDRRLEPPMDPSLAPHGWLVAPGVKRQDEQLMILTRAQRAAIDEAMATYLADWEAEYTAGERDDYPLIPGGRLDRDELEPEPISDKALRKGLEALFKAAGIEKQPGDRKGFHAIRRAMSDIVEEEEGLDTLQAAGGWKKRETIEGHGYTEREKRRRIARAAKHMEGE